MRNEAGPKIGLVVVLLLAGLAGSSWGAAEEGEHQHHEVDTEQHHQGDAVESMTSEHQHKLLHMKWTAKRPVTSEDLARAGQIVRALRASLEKYRDYHVAIREGFEPFLPQIPQPHYHFTRKMNGFKAAFRFDPEEPTSLLYGKTTGGYELIGAMYTAGRWASESKLDARVPLSVAQWHAHVNICLPKKGTGQQADWTKFGFKGSIATEAECDQAHGRWFSQIYGWMLHVHPFETTPEKIWTH
jgi:hypothetical protein